MNKLLNQINTDGYEKCALEITEFTSEKESKEYDACRFKLNGLNIISRNGKRTPKKVGQFVTFWKRSEIGPIEPFNEIDSFDFYVVNLQTKTELGQFVFPKSVLIKKGIISTKKKEGKRAFRVYPIWDIANNKQALRTQKWQLDYFYQMDNSTDLKRVVKLYNKE